MRLTPPCDRYLIIVLEEEYHGFPAFSALPPAANGGWR
jgi:hypothetical protein